MPPGPGSERVGIVDDHAHPFPLTADVLDLGEITLDVDPDPGAVDRRRRLAPGRLLVEAMQVRLAVLLDCPVADIGAARADAARDWPVYVRRLFADVGVAGMLLDGGHRPVGAGALERSRAVAGAPMWSLFRIESVLDPLIASGAGVSEILAGVAQAIDRAAADGAVGCKTVLAYRTGLAVDPAASLTDARSSLAQHGAAGPVRRRAKALRDLVLRRSMAQCGELGLPLQIHTGFGDSELRLADADPLGLDDVLRTPEGSHASVVLIHAAYPWHEKVAYLAAVRPSVWAEFSLVNLLSPVTSADRLLSLIELAPTSRILTGSDGHGSPETHWFALSVLRDAWDQVRARLNGIARDAWLADVERAVLAENAIALYRLTEVGPAARTS